VNRPADPPYRNLRVWVACFDLALDVFQAARRLRPGAARSLAHRLIDTASRLPVSIARGQSSGSGSEFASCLHQALCDLSELETLLLMCAELRHLPVEEVRGFIPRLAELRRMTAALRQRITSVPPVPASAAADPAPRRGAARTVSRLTPDGRLLGVERQRGAALVVTLIACATLTALGLAVVQMGEISLRTAARARDREALREVAESGARAVKRWFDAPASGDPAQPATLRHLFLGRFDLRDPSLFVRVRRLLDHDGDPATSLVPADGTSGRELYRQGRLDLFHKPWRAGTLLALSGPERGPDLVLEDQDGVVDTMDRINAALFDDQTAGRLLRIEIHGPGADASGRRLGMAEVDVTAARYARLAWDEGLPVAPPGSDPVDLAVVRFGLAEIPLSAPRGPLSAWRGLTVVGPLRARWGRVVAGGDVRLAATVAALDTTVASGFPYASVRRRIEGTPLAAWQAQPLDRVEDPWLKVLARGSLLGWEALGDQPFPHDPGLPPDRDHSNLFQRVAGAACPAFDYATWKTLVTTSLAIDEHVHHFAFDASSGLFREGGAGPARSVRDWTHGRDGIFFFDTTDGRPPTGSNLTPPVVIAGGEWSTAGLIYLNAVSFYANGAAGAPRVLIPPGEPYDDANGNLSWDAGETFVNLAYATTAETGFPTDDMRRQPLAAATAAASSGTGEMYEETTTASRDMRGLPISASVNLFGVLYNAGNILGEGDAVHFGSLIAGDSIVQVTPGAASPVIYFDDRLAGGAWPPPEIAVPRTAVTVWQTQHP
jgi:four helix bundle protein